MQSSFDQPKLFKKRKIGTSQVNATFSTVGIISILALALLTSCNQVQETFDATQKKAADAINQGTQIYEDTKNTVNTKIDQVGNAIDSVEQATESVDKAQSDVKKVFE